MERDTVVKHPFIRELKSHQSKEPEEDRLNQATFIDEEEVSPEQEKKLYQLELYRILFQDCLSLNLIEFR